jgi:O-methyltransferase/methyltransferase family protein
MERETMTTPQEDTPVRPGAAAESAGNVEAAKPQAALLDMIHGGWRSRILYAGVRLGIFDAIDNEPKTADAIARFLSLDLALSYRLLRALAGIGLLRERPERTFSLTEAGQFLRGDHPRSLRGVALLIEGPENVAIWKHLPAMVRDGKQDGFIREYGRTAFQHAAHEPTYAEAFDEGMTSRSRLQTPEVLEALQSSDFGAITHVCDVGGGRGHLLCHLLARYPNLRGTVLERASVIEDPRTLWAERLQVADRCQYLAGNMFEDVPPADAYLMKMILHDWNDEECVQILKVLHQRATPGGQVFIAEYVIRETDGPDLPKLLDIHMMCWGTGRERTSKEYAALLRSAGWRYVTSRFPAQGAMGVVEGAKV